MTDTATPARRPRHRYHPAYHVPSERPWHEYLRRLRAKIDTEAKILKLRAERGLHGEEREADDKPLTLTGAVNRREARPARVAEPVQPAAAHGAARNAPCPCGSGRKFKACCRGNAPQAPQAGEQNSVPAAG